MHDCLTAMASLESRHFIDQFSDFITQSATSYHTVQALAKELTAAGYTELDETRPWAGGADRGSGTAGLPDVEGRHFVRREGALIAWHTPAKVSDSTRFRVVGSHTDSPGFSIKPNPSMTEGPCQTIDVEIYGGPLLNSWLDRELGVAGRIVTSDGQVHLVESGPILKIPQLPPHLDRTQNDSLSLSKQRHLTPLAGYSDPGLDLIEYLCDLAGIDPGQVAFWDLLTFPTEAPQVFGINADMFGSRRMDNLSSVFPSVRALVEITDPSDIAVMACFDHEEIGSSTRTGACGPFLEDIVVRIAAGLGFTGDRYRALLARSVCVSADAGHGLNPNYLEKFDVVNRPILNGGPLVKVNAQHRYATDALGTQIWLRACADAEVPSQFFVSNNDVTCGTTIGPLTATRMGLLTVDVGIGLLAMHSARETCGVDDPLLLSKAMKAFWMGE